MKGDCSLPEHMGSSPSFSGIRVGRYLVFFVVFCRSLFDLLSFLLLVILQFPSSIYSVWLPLCYLQTSLCFVDIGEIVDHSSISFIFIKEDGFYLPRSCSL